MSPIRIQVFKVDGVDLTDPNGVIDAIRRNPKTNATFTKFEAECDKYVKAVHERCVAGLNEDERAWFQKWWEGKSINWNMVPKKAHGAISEAISAGCG